MPCARARAVQCDRHGAGATGTPPADGATRIECSPRPSARAHAVRATHKLARRRGFDTSAAHTRFACRSRRRPIFQDHPRTRQIGNVRQRHLAVVRLAVRRFARPGQLKHLPGPAAHPACRETVRATPARPGPASEPDPDILPDTSMLARPRWQGPLEQTTTNYSTTQKLSKILDSLNPPGIWASRPLP
jgi:hypothetical protein